MDTENNVITVTWKQVIEKLKDAVPKEVIVDWAHTGGNCSGIDLYPKHSKNYFPKLFCFYLL